MTASPFTLILTPENDPDRFLLTGGVITYPIELRPDINMALSDLLHNLHQEYNSERTFATSSLLREIGAKLWQVLMPDTVPIESRAALAHELRSSASHLRIAVPPSLATLPWELLCDPQQQETVFLAHQRPIVRVIPGGNNLSSLSPPLRVLLLISSSPSKDGQKRIDVTGERVAIEIATRMFREAGLLHLQIDEIVTPWGVQHALMCFKPHIVHYIGYGGNVDDAGNFLICENGKGQLLSVPAINVASLFRTRGLRAVLLQCSGMAIKDNCTNFDGLVNALIEAGIPAVLKLQTGSTDESNPITTEMLYTALATGEDLAEAIFEVRLGLHLADCSDWSVLTLRATMGALAPLIDRDAPAGIPDPTLVLNEATDALHLGIGNLNNYEIKRPLSFIKHTGGSIVTEEVRKQPNQYVSPIDRFGNFFSILSKQLEYRQFIKIRRGSQHHG